MKSMIKVDCILKLALLLVILSFNACSSAPNKVQIINVENEKWRITAIGVYQGDSGWVVRGKLSSPNIFDLPDGHILISVMDAGGVVINRKEVQYQRIIGSSVRHHKHQFGRALFSTNFQSIPKDAKIVAQFKIVSKNAD